MKLDRRLFDIITIADVSQKYTSGSLFPFRKQSKREGVRDYNSYTSLYELANAFKFTKTFVKCTVMKASGSFIIMMRKY